MKRHELAHAGPILDGEATSGTVGRMEPITSDTEARPAELQIRLKRRTFLKGLLGATAALLGGNFLAACGNTVREDATVTSPMASPTAAPSPAPTSTPTPPPTATPRPTPTELPWVYPNGPSKLGLHTVSPNGAFPFVRSVTEAGGLIRLMKAVGNFGILREVKSVSPQTVTIGRWPYVEAVDIGGDPAQAAERVLRQHMEAWQYERDVVDYWEVLNEVDPGSPEGHVWLARFYWAAMELAEAQGYRLALFSYSTGVPEWTDWAAIVETGIFARAAQGGHILALHEYDWPFLRLHWGGSLPGQPIYDPDRGVLAGRYRHLYRDFLIPRGEVIPLAITECGLDPGVGEQEPDFPWQRHWLKELAWYDSKLVEDDYVIGAAIFTLGGTDSRYFDYENMLPDLREYLLRLKDL